MGNGFMGDIPYPIRGYQSREMTAQQQPLLLLRARAQAGQHLLAGGGPGRRRRGRQVGRGEE